MAGEENGSSTLKRNDVVVAWSLKTARILEIVCGSDTRLFDEEAIGSELFVDELRQPIPVPDRLVEQGEVRSPVNCGDGKEAGVAVGEYLPVYCFAHQIDLRRG
jgi:hypothetical protein